MNALRMAVILTPPLLLPEEVHNTEGEGLLGEIQESQRGGVGHEEEEGQEKRPSDVIC